MQVRFEQGLAESAFSGLVSGQSQQTNLPDQADPNQPRIIFQSDKKTIVISQLACQIQLGFKDSDLPISKQIEIAQKNVSEFYDRALKFRPLEKFAMSGLVFDINFPSTSPLTEVNQYVADRFLRVPQLGEMSSAQANFSYKIDDVFYTIAASADQTHRLEIQMNNLGAINPTILPESASQIIEAGVSIKIDVNDLPRVRAGSKITVPPAILTTALDSFLANHLFDISGLALK